MTKPPATREALQQAILRQRLQRRLEQHAADGAPRISRADRDAALPLSWAQQRLWFLDRLDPSASAAYHLAAGLQLRGVLDTAALRAALDYVVARHENLRTTFVEVDGAPVQRIAPAAIGCTLIAHDLSALDAAAQSSAVASLSADEAQAPFDLAQGPLIRGRLLQLSDREHVLLLTQHHIVSDGWSIGVLVNEVCTLYAAFRAGKPDPLPALTIQYADYAAWQRCWLQGDVLERQVGYWRTQLAGAPALLELPADRPRPAVQSYRGGTLALELPVELTAALRALSQRHGTTLFMTLLAGWSVLLSRLSGQDDVVVGSPVANRGRAEVEPLIGFFVNTLALRVRVHGTVAELLAQVKATALQGYAHQELPFEQVVEAVQPPRSLGHSPVFQTMLSLNNTPVSSASLAGLDVTPIEPEQGTTQFDLSLSFVEAGDRLLGSLQYAGDLFDATTIARWANHLQTLLAAMAVDASQPVQRLPLLCADERMQLLEGFNATAAAFDTGTLHGLFEAQVARTPDAIAVIDADASLTYAELDRRANRIAHRLHALGLQPDDRVALCLERGAGMIAALLGVLKAGGAYVPLDPAHPAERLAHVIGDSTPRAVLAEGRTHAALPAIDGVPMLLLDDVSDAEPAHALSVAASAEQLAYVIYTSGSTGQPKGVMVEHRSAVNLLHAHTAQCGLQAGDRVLQFATYAFDTSVEEIFPTLAIGATLVLRPAGMVAPDAAFAEFLRVQQIDIVDLPTAFWQQWAIEVERGRCLPPACVRLIVVGGEKLEQRHLAQWMAAPATRHCAVLNTYGPTETTVYVVAARFDADALPMHDVPIGRPTANTRAYVLDAYGTPVPIGVIGELHVGGVQVARGYLRRPELTAEKFIDDPFAGGERMYRTGDLARWRADGTLEYAGRNDDQVKLRGFRIELGEIEARLVRCAGVREAVVVAREDGGDKRLIAYVVADAGAVLSPVALRDALARELADYMLPSAFVALDALPLTGNGKIDRRALPAPDADALARRAYAAPVGDTEHGIAAIWQALLNVAQVGRDDHFFELGGHSLLATRVVSEIARRFGKTVPVRALFEHGTLARLAAYVDAQPVTGYAAIPVIERDGPLPLSFAQQRLWFIDRLEGGSAQYNMPIALRLTGRLDVAAMQRALDTLLARHEVLRTVYVDIDGTGMQQVQPAMPMAVRHADLRNAADQEGELAALAQAEAATPFDLTRDAMVRATLVALGDDAHALLFTLHHIAADGWSIGVLVQEFVALYSGGAVPALAIQYADYAAWQRARLQGEALEQQLGYWREQLAALPAVHGLPLDRPRPAQQRFAGRRIEQAIDRSTLDGLHALARRHDASLFMVLHAAFAALLARWSGETDIVVGTPIAGRTHKDVEPLIGFFVNTLVLRSDLSGDPGVDALIAQSRAMTLDAYAHQDVPFEMLVEDLKPVRSLSHAPLCQVLFTLQNTASVDLELPELTIAPLATGFEASKFDLQVSMSEDGNGLGVSWLYAEDLFDASTITRLGAAYARLLRAIIEAPASTVGELVLQAGDEAAALRAFGRGPDSTRYRDAALPLQIMQQAARTPDAIAVRDADHALTYAQFDRVTNRLAQALRARGIGRGARVGVHRERSVELLVALVAVQKAGAAYVMLDHRQTAERLQRIVSDAGVEIVLLDSRHSLLPDTIEAIHLDDACDAGWLSEYLDSALDIAIDADDTAYVLYTSGSTGVPKGVEIRHGGLTDYCAFAREGYYAAHLHGSLVVTSAAFDLTVPSLYVPLMTGGCVELLPAEDELIALAQTLERDAAPVLLRMTPSHLQGLLALADAQPRHSAHVFVIGGEAFGVVLARQLQAKYPHAQLYNHYGPTETVVGCCWYDVTANLSTLDRTIPIGRPMSNTTLHVLSATGQLQPIGVAGELYIGGAGVARGYVNQPELTAAKFVADPFVSGARVYRSGDRVRWRADGLLEFLGRFDDQVKVRGFRIELGDIEAAVRRCAQVRDAVVVVRGEDSDARLVAYVVADEHAELIAQLQAQVAEQLPAYMQPAAWVVLEHLPLTANGKVDRNALPAPVFAAAVHVAPETDTERQLAEIWQQVLGIEQVSVTADFFALGGHSLLATRLINAVQRRLQIDIPIRLMFEQSDIRSIAARIDDQHIRQRNLAIAHGSTAHVELEW